MWSSEAASSKAPLTDTRPQVGFRPVTPLAADGKRIDPPVSVPSDPKHRPAAVATPEPLDDAPDQWSACQGFTGGRMSGWWSANAPSVICSLPSSTAPASRRRETTVPSKLGTKSRCIGMPARGRDALGEAQVLQRDRHAVQRPEDAALHHQRLGLARLRERELGRDQRVGAQPAGRAARCARAWRASARPARACACAAAARVRPMSRKKICSSVMPSVRGSLQRRARASSLRASRTSAACRWR